MHYNVIIHKTIDNGPVLKISINMDDVMTSEIAKREPYSIFYITNNLLADIALLGERNETRN